MKSNHVGTPRPQLKSEPRLHITIERGKGNGIACKQIGGDLFLTLSPKVAKNLRLIHQSRTKSPVTPPEQETLLCVIGLLENAMKSEAMA